MYMSEYTPWVNRCGKQVTLAEAVNEIMDTKNPSIKSENIKEERQREKKLRRSKQNITKRT